MLDALIAHGRPRDDAAAHRLRRHAADAGDDRRHARRDCVARRASSRPTAARRFSSSAASSALREHLRWFDARPLFGKRILVTRPREQAAELVELLEAMGAEAIEAPMIRIVPPDDYGPLDDACAHAGEFDWIVFSSANAVDAFIDRLLAAAAGRARAEGRAGSAPSGRRRPSGSRGTA